MLVVSRVVNLLLLFRVSSLSEIIVLLRRDTVCMFILGFICDSSSIVVFTLLYYSNVTVIIRNRLSVSYEGTLVLLVVPMSSMFIMKLLILLTIVDTSILYILVTLVVSVVLYLVLVKLLVLNVKLSISPVYVQV